MGGCESGIAGPYVIWLQVALASLSLSAWSPTLAPQGLPCWVTVGCSQQPTVEQLGESRLLVSGSQTFRVATVWSLPSLGHFPLLKSTA